MFLKKHRFLELNMCMPHLPHEVSVIWTEESSLKENCNAKTS